MKKELIKEYLLYKRKKDEIKYIPNIRNYKKKEEQSTQNSNESQQKQINNKYIQRWIFDI